MFLNFKSMNLTVCVLLHAGLLHFVADIHYGHSL